MDNNMLERAELALAKKKKRSVWLRIVSVLGCVVVFCTTYALILPAITMTRQTICGLEEHTHTVQCYETRTVEGETVLSCGAEEELHTHSDNCYDSNHVPVCGYANYYVHVHNDRCYEGNTLVCDLQEIKEHTHGGNCFESEQKLICTLEEGGEIHTHDDACYSQEKTLVCELEEGGEVHVHEDGCYAQEQTLTCGQEEAEGVHAHSGECYTTESRLVCEKEEKIEVHTHTEECYNTTSTLTCEKEEVTETHTHGEECYETVETLTCRKTEVKLHIHGSSCFRTEEDGSETLVCTQVQVLEHVHSDSCFAAKTEQVVICGLEEHSHVDECYPVEETTGPTENETVPTEGEAVPTEGETTPDGDENAPTEGETTPIEDEDEPTEGETMPAEDENDPTEGETVPAETVPAEKTTPVGDGTISAEVEKTAPVFLSDGTTTEVASGTCGDNLTWTITELDGVKTLTISGEGEMKSLGYPSTPWYNYRAEIEKVEIGETVTSLCNFLCYYCTEMTEIDIPDRVTTIGQYAFSGCTSLTSIDIPDSVNAIGYRAFNKCSGLASVNLPAGFVTIGVEAFAGCTNLDGNLQNLTEGDYYIDEQGIVYLLSDGIAYVKYQPEGTAALKTVFDEENSMVYIVGGESTLVASGTWGSVAWAVSELDSVQTLSIFGNGAMGTAYYPSAVPWDAYEIANVEIGDGVTSICNFACYRCSNLTSITIPESITTIGSQAFDGCGLTSIVIPEGVTNIGLAAFSGCTSLTTAEIPDSVTSLGKSVFENCTSLISVEIPANMTSINSSVFEGCRNLTSISIPESVVSIGENAFYGCSGLTSINIPDSVTSIGDSAFCGCSSLNTVDLPTGFVTIGEMVFADCIYLDADLQGLLGEDYYIDEQDIAYLLGDGIAYVQYQPEGTTALEIIVDEENGTEYIVSNEPRPVASGSCGENVTWTLMEQNKVWTLTISGEGPMTNASSSSNVPWSDYVSKIDNIVINEGVTTIGNYAFYSCSNLTNIELPESVTSIGSYAFENCTGLTSFSIPEGVTSLGYSVFNGCSSLASITIPEYWKSIDYMAFYGCSGLESITIPDGVSYISNYAFYGCSSLTSIDLPDGVNSIGTSAFEGCGSMTDIDLPTGLLTLGSNVFKDCGLDADLRDLTDGEYYIDEQGVVYQFFDMYACAAYQPDGTILPETLLVEETGKEYPVLGTCTASGTAGTNAYWILYNDGTEDVLLIYGSGAMQNYSNRYSSYASIIDRVEIDERVTSICSSAFYNCSSLTSIDIPEGVTSIGDSAFYNCSSLTSIDIPEGVTSIGSSAFYNCTSLTEIDLPLGFVTFGSSVFSGCSGLDTELRNLKEGTYYIDEQDVMYQSKGSYAYVVYQPVGAVIPEKVYWGGIGEEFPVLGKLRDSGTAGTSSYSVYWVLYNDGTEDVLWIYGSGDMKAFASAGAVPWNSYCTIIDRVKIDARVKSIGNYAFNNCSSLTSINIPDGVTSIPDYCFNNCSSLTSIDIPDSVTSIGTYAFSRSSLTSIDIPDSVTSVGNGAFRGCSSLTSIEIPEGVTAIPSYCFQDCSSLTSIEIPDSVTSIGNYAFRNCSALETIYLDASQMTSVGSSAFSGCSNLREIIIGSSVDVLSPALFKNAGSGKKISFEGPNYFTLGDDFTESDVKTYLDEDLSFLRAGSNYFVDENGAVYLVDNGIAYYMYSPMSNYIAPQTIPTEAFDGTTYPVYSAKLPDVVKRDGDLIWMVYGDRLMILGECEIPNYSETGAPWYSYRGDIEEIVLADTITGIGNFAFNGFGQVTEIEIPRDAAAVSTSAFRNCTSLRNFTVDAENTAFSEENGILYNADQTVLVLCPPAKRSAREIPATVTTIGNYAFAYNDSLTGVTLPDAMETIETNAFYDCDGLTSITIPGETVTVGENAFYDCDGLNTVRVTAADAEIGKNAFYDCDAVTAVTVTSQTSAIGEGAFRSCDALEQVKFAALPDTISTYAFADCGALTTLEIPAGYLTLGDSAFSGTNLTLWNQAKSGLHYLDEQGALYWICDGLAYYVGCPETVTDYRMLSLTPQIGDYGPYPVDSDFTAGDFLDYGTTGDLYWYIVDDNGRQTLVITGEGEMPDYTAGTAPWNAYIGVLDDIMVEEGVTTIGNYAFASCKNITSIALPDTLEIIGSQSFYLCSSLKEITIPTRVTSLGGYAFEGCSGLQEINILGPITIIKDATFRNCVSLTRFVIPDTVKTIGFTAFDYCKGLKEVVIPSSVETISGSAFRGCCSLENVVIPDSVTSMDNSVFISCTKLEQVTLSANLKSIPEGTFQYCTSLKAIEIPDGVTTIGTTAFDGCSALAEVHIPETVTEIINQTFRNCTSLTEITIPGSVTVIGHNVFNGCTSLKDVTICEGLKRTNTLNFAGCTSLTEITIPGSLSTIAAHSFAGCTNLEKVILQKGTTNIAITAFSGCTKLKEIILPEGYITIHAQSFQNTPLDYLSGTIYTDTNGVQYKIIDSKAYVVFQPEDVTDDMIPDYIDEAGNNYPVVKDSVILASGQCGDDLYWEILKTADSETLRIYGTGDMYTYYYNYGSESTNTPWNSYSSLIDKVVIEDGATTIGDYAFYDCNSLAEIVMPESVTIIEDYAFYRCSSLAEIVIPESVTVIGEYAFYSCTNLTDIHIPEGVTSIEKYTFQNCASLTNITIPEGVTSIGIYAFDSCTALARVDIPNSVKTIGAYAFQRCTNLISVTIPEGVKSISSQLFCYCSSLESITIPESVTSIGYYAFGFCDALTEIIIPNSVTRMDQCAFRYCKNLNAVRIGKGIATLPRLTFDGCDSLTTVYLSASGLSSVEDIGGYVFSNRRIVETIIVEPGVDILYPALFKTLKRNGKGYGDIQFTGPNHFSISTQMTISYLQGTPANLMAPGGSYYVDVQGVIYQISDGAATLLHVPAGITEFTVPAAIPAADEGEETVPVIGVATGALEAATDLTALVFESPEAITSLADCCMANCPTLLSVNGFTTVREAKEIFTNENVQIDEDILFNTGLVSELEEWLSQRQTSENAINVETDGVTVTVTTSTEKNTATEGNMAFYTGQEARSTVYFDRQSESLQQTAYVYFCFSNPNETFNLGLGEKEFETTAPEGADPYEYKVNVSKLPYTNIYCMELEPLKMGYTVEIPVPYRYANGTEGGELLIWVEVFEREEQKAVSDVTQKLTWETEPFDFDLTKKVRVQPKFSGDGTEGSSFAIYDLSYEVKLSPIGNSRNAPSGVGYDSMTRAEFVDVLTFPESENGQKLSWAEGVTAAVANGEWVSQKYMENNRQVGWEVAVPIDGQLKTLLAVRDTAVTDLNVSLTENRDIAFGWTKANGNINTPNPTFTQYVDVGDGMIVGESITDLNEDKEFQLHNDVSAAQYFRFSDIQEDQAQCAHVAATNAAVMEAKKTADRGYTAYFGESYPYTITLKNTGTQHLHALNKIEDDLPADLYITPEDMFEMLTEGRDGEYLTITISEATIYNQLPEGITVTGTDGKEYVPDIQNTSIETWYHGMEWDEAAGCIASTGAKLVLKQAEGGVSVSLNGGEARLASGEDELRQVLFDLGYFVTPLARYSVTWEFPEGMPMWSSEERDYHILSTVKDAFMAISWDHTWTPIWDGSEPAKSKEMVANYAKITYVLSEGMEPVSGEEVKVEKSTTLKRDFWVNTEYWTDSHGASSELIEGGGLVNLCVSVDHDGTASYDMVPFVSQMTGAQMLVVRVSDNPHLAAESYGLTVRTIGGIDYFLLDRDGEYPNVKIGGYLADCVKVDVNDNDPNSITTQMRWYLTNIKGHMDMHIDCKVLMVTNGEVTSSSVFAVDNEVWLNDHQTHRLWASMGSKWSFASFDKQIVTNHVEGTSVHDVADPDDETVLHDGDSVTYRLKITGMLSSASVQAGRTVVVPGTAIYDQLPKNTAGWEFGKNIQKVEYVYNDAQVDIEGMDVDSWYLTDVNPDGEETEEDQQYLVWKDLFRITYHETSTVYIYITLDYPEGAGWGEYCNSYGSDMVTNTMYFSDDSESVRHSLYMSVSAKLVKGVSSTGVWKGDKYYPSTDSNSRFNYASEDNLNRIVTYYVALYNDGYTRLYLDDIQDKLPVGFTYQSNSVAVASDIADIGDDLGQEVTYKKAVISAAVEESTGNIRFTAGNGAAKADGTYEGDLKYDSIYKRYYLQPREALVFSYRCFVGPKAEAGIHSINTAAMAYFDYNLCGVNVGESTVTANGAELIFNNDGDCSVIADSTAGIYDFSSDLGEATQWLMSQVRVEKGNIVPGIEKRVSGVYADLGADAGISRTQATYYDFVTWEVITSNIGTTPMRDYVLTDVMQQTYDFEGEVHYTIHYGSNYVDNEKLTISGPLFTMAELIRDENLNGESGQYTMTGTSNVFGAFDVTYTPHGEQSPAVLAIHFRSAKAAIPEGGESVLSVATRNRDTYRTSTYTNTCYVTPSQTWDENQVTTGVQEAYNGKPSVRSSADIAVDSAYLTASLKEVTEKSDPSNRADSDDEVNSIVLSSGRSPFTYTLKIQNTGEEKDVMDKLVIIDSLPEIGDHSALKDTDPRYSEFAVWLAENPNFTVTVGGETLEPSAYDLQFTTKTSFSDDDWAGIGTGWDAASAEARAFRIILTGTVNEEGTYSGTVVPANTLVTVSFDAMIRAEDLTDGNALPGEIAWNSFGYNYRLFGSNVELASIPGKVGVKLPSIPQMIKKLETPDGRAWTAEKVQDFSYLIYALEEGLDIPELDGLTEDQIGEKLQKAGAAFTRVTLTVPEGATESDVLMLKDLHHWSVADGVWTEGDGEWTWTQGGRYVFMELPLKVAEGEIEEYTFGTINGNHRNHFVYVHDRAQTATIVGMNLRRVWNISLLKVSDGKQANPLSGAWFGLYGETAPAEAPVLPEALSATMTQKEFEKLLTLDYTEGEQTVTWYLQSVNASGSGGILLWQDLTDEQYLVREIQAPEGYHYDGTVHVVQRPEDVIFNTVSMSVVNRSGYEMPKSGGIGTNAVTTMGALLIAASGAMLLLLKRRRKGTKA